MKIYSGSVEHCLENKNIFFPESLHHYSVMSVRQVLSLCAVAAVAAIPYITGGCVIQIGHDSPATFERPVAYCGDM
jgi:hypothetical protein